MSWPSTEQLQRIKLSLEVLLLIVLIGVMLFTLSHDRTSALLIGLGAAK